MRKAQSLIIQFIIFFVIGFGLFVTVGMFFRFQSDTFRNDVVGNNLGLTGSYFSSAIISAVDTCKQCDYVQYLLKIENATAGYFLEARFSEKGINIRTVPGEKMSTYSIYNLNESLDLSGLTTSVKPINLTFSRTKNELRVE